MLRYVCFRRKVRKEFLFKYLHAKRIEGIDPAADKSVIISHVLALWGVNDQGITKLRIIHLGVESGTLHFILFLLQCLQVNPNPSPASTMKTRAACPRRRPPPGTPPTPRSATSISTRPSPAQGKSGAA